MSLDSEDDEDRLGPLDTEGRPATYGLDLPEDCELLLATATADRCYVAGHR